MTATPKADLTDHSSQRLRRYPIQVASRDEYTVDPDGGAGRRIPLSGTAPPVCAPAIGDDARSISQVRGAYRVLGLRGEQPYSGELTLSGAEGSESVEVLGTVDGSPRQGTARYVLCGPDRVNQLELALAPGQALYCVRHNDYDNFNRLSCTKTLSDPNGDHELWIERYTP